HDGNAFRSAIFPELSPENMDPESDLYKLLYDSEGAPLRWQYKAQNQEVRDAIAAVVRQNLQDRVSETIRELEEMMLVTRNEEGRLTETENQWIPEEVKQKYGDNVEN